MDSAERASVQAVAIIEAILQIAKDNGIEPQNYLNRITARIESGNARLLFHEPSQSFAVCALTERNGRPGLHVIVAKLQLSYSQRRAWEVLRASATEAEFVSFTTRRRGFSRLLRYPWTAEVADNGWTTWTCEIGDGDGGRRETQGDGQRA